MANQQTIRADIEKVLDDLMVGVDELDPVADGISLLVKARDQLLAIIQREFEACLPEKEPEQDDLGDNLYAIGRNKTIELIRERWKQRLEL